MKLHAKGGKRIARLLCIALSVMLIVTMIPIREIGRVCAEPKDDNGLQSVEEQGEDVTDPLPEENDQEIDTDADQSRETEDADVISDPFSEYWDADEDRYVLSSGTYIMPDDFTAQGYLYVPSGETVTIDLAGFALKRELASAVAKGYVIENDGTLTIQDSSGNNSGMITGGKNGGKSMSGGGIYNFGTFNLEGGNITGNQARIYGGGIYNGNGGTVNITGGSITNNTAQKGGGISNSGTMSISNATISGNIATADRGGACDSEQHAYGSFPAG